jgi:hypothetical protein
MGLFGKAKTFGEKARDITLAEIGNRKILYEIAGNNRYLIITEDLLFVGSIGIASGSLAGKKVKRYPIDLITSVDVRQSTMFVELEINISGSHSVDNTNASFKDRIHNENIITFPRDQYDKTQRIAAYILDIRQRLKNIKAVSTEPESDVFNQLRQLAELKSIGVISEEEFQLKKSQLLGRIK